MCLKKQLIVFFATFVVSVFLINGTIYGIVAYRNFKFEQFDSNKNGFIEVNEQYGDCKYWDDKCNNSSLHMLFLSKETFYISLIVSVLFTILFNLFVKVTSHIKKYN